MPVVACDCGKNLRVPGEYVGKRLQCPACGSVQRVEDRTAGGTDLATAETVRVACDCGRRFRVDASYAGRTGKCPGCGTKVLIPGREYDPIPEADPDEPPLGSRIDAMLARKKAAAEAEAAAPKKGKKGKKKAGSLVPAMLLLGVVFAAAAGAAYYFLFMQDDASKPINKGPGATTQVQQRPAPFAVDGELKRIGGAFHAFAVTNKDHLPAWATPGPDRKPLHSWRVALLPHLGEEELHKQLRLDEPWDSDHNKQFHDKMPKVFEVVGREAPPGQTYYQGFVGPGAIFDKAAPQGRTLAGITDGTATTLLVVEAATPVNWMEPKDLDFMPAPAGFDPAGKLGGHVPDGFLALYANGKVEVLPLTTPPADVQALITVAGGEVVTPRTP